MSDYLKFALRTAILIEKQSLDFYLYVSKMVVDRETRQLFRLLAFQEEEHLRQFDILYQERDFGDLQGLLKQPPDFDTPAYRALIKSVNTNTLEKEALKISMREEQACIDIYSDLASGFKEPGVRKVFEHALFETRMHLKIIQTEYMRITRTPCMLAEIGHAADAPAARNRQKLLADPKIIDAQLDDA